MVYLNKFTACVKVNGRVLREKEDSVAIPFGSEYSIFLSNLNSVRALVRVSIDGEQINDIGDGWLIIGANEKIDLERFIRNGNLNKGNRFKFIERTSKIEEFKGIGTEDGLIRIEYKYEIPQPVYNGWPHYTITNGSLGGNSQYTITNCGFQGGQETANINTVFTSTTATSASPASTMLRSKSVESPTKGRQTMHAENVSFRSVEAPDSFKMSETSFNEAGITVAGGESQQKFSYGSWFPTEGNSQVLVLKLVGKVGEQAVVKPVTVQQKIACMTCGKMNKPTFKFCGDCGTALQLF